MLVPPRARLMLTTAGHAGDALGKLLGTGREILSEVIEPAHAGGWSSAQPLPRAASTALRMSLRLPSPTSPR
jgi:hypothetical protein